jgi:DNA polymerase elongation subunit (family B)
MSSIISALLPYPISDDKSFPMSEEEKIIIKPITYEEEENFEDTHRVSLHIYGLDRNSRSTLLVIRNFRIYCCLELPTHSLNQKIPNGCDIKSAIYEPDQYISWDIDIAKKVFISLRDKLSKSLDYKTKEYKEPPFDFYFDFFSKTYNYTGVRKPYIYLYFNNIKDRKNLLESIKYPIYIKGEGYMKFIMHENKITTFRRLNSNKHCQYSQWLQVNGRKVPFESKHRISKKPLIEYIINYESMVSIPISITSQWFVYPKILSFDCEMYSKNHKQMPSHKRLRDKIYLISLVFQIMEHPETMRKICLINGECNDIPDVEVIRFKTEKDLLIGFCNSFNYFDPDIVMSYNGFGFDYPYIIGRFERNEIIIEDIPSTGRLLRKKTSIYEMDWQSSGSGKNSITFINHEGRIPIDMLPNIRRLYKLRQYTLQYVSMHFLKEGKHDITAKKMFEIYESSMNSEPGSLEKMTDVAAYCVQDSILPIKLFDNRKIWYHLCSLSSAAGVSILELFTRGEQIRTYSNIAYECYKRRMVLSNPEFYDYPFKGGFVGKPIPGVFKFIFTLDFNSLYPSIMIGYNLSMDSLIKIEDWDKFPEGTYIKIEFEQEELKDLISLSYRKDLEDKYKLCKKGYYVKFTQEDLDTLIKTNISDGKNIPINPDSEDRIELIDDIKDPEDFTGKTTIKRRYEFRFTTKEVHTGIMPQLEETWLIKRKATKKLMGACEKQLEIQFDQIIDNERSAHNASQNADKIMMNSGYGFCGVPSGMLPALPIAISVTAKGRELIEVVNNVLVDNYKHYNGKIIYNDTDSSMLCLDISEEDVLSGKIDLKELKKEMEDIVNGREEKTLEDGTIIPGIKPIFVSSLKMECENVCQMCTIKPKYYIKAIREVDIELIRKNGFFKKDHTGKIEIITKGILTAKKGNSQFVNNIYNDLVNKVIFLKHTVEILYSLSKYVCDFLSDKFNSKDLCRVTKLGSDYKLDNYFMNVFANYLSDHGMPVKAGDHLEYLIVKTKNEILTGKDENVGFKCREYSMWLLDQERESIDYAYYIEHGLQKQYDELFCIGSINIVNDPNLINLVYKPQFSKCHPVHFKDPIKMITALVKDYMKLTDEEFIKIYTSYGYIYDHKYPKNVYIATILNNFIDSLCKIILKFHPMKEM